MKKTVLFFLGFLTFSVFSFADNYTLDHDKVDALFSLAEEVSVDEVSSVELGGAASHNASFASASVSPWAAWAVCWVGGGLGIHRHYLGTSNNMWALYTFTCCGIFGVVPLVDWVVLFIGAINEDIRSYQNNKNFFMW